MKKGLIKIEEKIKEIQECKLTKTSLIIPENTTIENWGKIGETLKIFYRANKFWLGDWLNFGERKYGEMFSQELEETDFEYHTLQNYKWVAGSIEMSLRKDNLSFSHHNLVAGLLPIEQEKWLNKAEKEKLDVRELAEIIKKANKLPTPELPKGKYQVIYSDPPWQYDNSGISGAAENHYPTMATEDICKLKIPSAENSVLFLWTTNPFLKEGLQVCERWGFEYKTNIVWIKEKAGQGFYVKGQHELLFIAVKGNFRPDDSLYIRSVVEVPKSKEHSQKPEIFYEIIEKMYPNTKKLELFSRNKRKNWDMWGMEVPK